MLAFAAVMVAVLVPFRAAGQLIVTHGTSLGMTPDSLVRSVLVGQGVDVYNVKFNNSTGIINCNAIGTFTTGNNPTNLGLSSGIIIGTGDVSFAQGPNNSDGGNGNAGAASCVSQQCAPLMNDASGTLSDCAVLEFDFVPRSDSIKFRYVFASEEYPEYVCSNVNDIFAFYISGPNPAGSGNYSNYNMARVPVTDDVISINTLNVGVVGANGSITTNPCVLTNSQYYVSNTGGTTIQYDGFTTVLTAKAKVFPCQQYHLIIAIADCGAYGSPDNVYDSGVFLEANSLSSNAISFTFDNSANPMAPSDLYEGCQAKVVMTRPMQMPTNTTIHVQVEGDVSNGVDFDPWMETFSFPANSDTLVKILAPYVDNEIEGTEFARFVMWADGGCMYSDTMEFNILDVEPLNVTIEHDTLTSSTTNVQLRANITGGMPNRTVTWTDLLHPTAQPRTGEAIMVNTFNDMRWLVEVEDACIGYGSDTMLVGVRHDFARLSPDTTICASEPLDLVVTGADSCVWFISGQTQPFATGSDTVHLEPEVMARYVVHSYKWWNNQYWEDVDSMICIVIPKPNVQVSASAMRICEGSSVTLSATGTNKYSWDGGETFEEASTHTYLPDSTTTYVIYGLTVGADCYGNDTIVITVDTIPDIVIDAGEGVCGGEEAELTVQTSAESFSWSASPADPTLGGQEQHGHIIVNPASTTVYTVNAVNGVCTNSESVTVAVEPQPVAIGEVTPRTVSLGTMEAVFTDKSEHATTRRWEFPDGVVKTEQEVSYIVPDDVDSVNVMLWAYNPYMCFDTTTITVYVDHTTLWIPNAFTPEESTNNTFLVKMNDIQRYHIFIYDRRGQLVFESYDPEQAWDGKAQNGEKCPQGVYTYLISCHKITYPFDQIVRKGTVVLIR